MKDAVTLIQEAKALWPIPLVLDHSKDRRGTAPLRTELAKLSAQGHWTHVGLRTKHVGFFGVNPSWSILCRIA